MGDVYNKRGVATTRRAGPSIEEFQFDQVQKFNTSVRDFFIQLNFSRLDQVSVVDT